MDLWVGIKKKKRSGKMQTNKRETMLVVRCYRIIVINLEFVVYSFSVYVPNVENSQCNAIAMKTKKRFYNVAAYFSVLFYAFECYL